MSVEERAGPDEQLGRRAASGVLWLAAQKWAVRASGFATLIVLTRQVSPKEFGVVAAAMTVIPMVYLLADLGFSTYLLQTDELDDRSLSTAFWSSVTAGGVLSAALFLSAPLLADAFGIPQLAPVLRVLILAVVATVLAGVPLAMLRRAMAFRAVAMQALVAALLAQLVAVVIALRGGGVWALVGQTVVSQWVIALLAWRGARWMPSLRLSARQFWRMAVFGFRVSGVDLIAMVRIWAEAWIITVTLGPAALGLLNVGQRLVFVAQELTAASLVPVSTVVFAKVRESTDRLGATYLKALGVAYGVVSPLMVLIAVTAPVLVPMLFGDTWRASVQPAQALALAGILTLGAMLDHGLFYGLGRPGAWLAYALLLDAATVGTTAVAVRWGIPGVAVGFVVVAVLATGTRWFLVRSAVGLPLRAITRPFFAVMGPTVLSLAAGTTALHLLSGAGLAGLVGAAVACLITYVVALRLVAGTIILDGLGILPLPGSCTALVRRLLLLPAGPSA